MAETDWLKYLRAPDQIFDNHRAGMDTGFIYWWGKPVNHRDCVAHVAISTKASGVPHVMQVELDLYFPDAGEIMSRLQDPSFRKEHGLEPGNA